MTVYDKLKFSICLIYEAMKVMIKCDRKDLIITSAQR